jgi:ribonuclease III
MTVDPLATLEKSIGHQFANRSILCEALSHSSHNNSEYSYERLEFLGDRVLGLLLADHFYAAFPQDDEGALSLRLHGEARMSTLANIAKDLQLADHIKSQSGLDIAGNDGVMADVVESLMAAIYLDAGLEAARGFLQRHWPLNSLADAQNEKDAKSKLQEWSLQRGLGLPAYRQLAKSGPDHAPQMTYEVKIESYDPVVATAGSRKVAEQTAAASLLALLQERTSYS